MLKPLQTHPRPYPGIMAIPFQPPPLYLTRGVGASLGPKDFVCLSISPYAVLGLILHEELNQFGQ